MKLTTDEYFNTGGGCMVMYVDVVDGGEIIQFGCNDEMVVALDDIVENTSVWYIDEYSELVESVGADIAKQLHERFLKHEDSAQWFPKDLGSEITDFMKHCEDDVSEMLQSDEYDKKHDIVITVNGKSLSIELCAQIHQDFMGFLQQVKDESEM